MEYKGYLIKLDKRTASHVIHHTGKGSLPNQLSGTWTTAMFAQRAIDAYLKTKDQ